MQAACYTDDMDTTINLEGTLANLGLTSANSIVIGSGILGALGIRKSNDIDVTVTAETYIHLSKEASFHEKQHHGHPVLVAGDLEVGTNWIVLGKNQTLDDLVKHSLILDGVRYVTLDFLLAVKRSWLEEDDEVRPKDRVDVQLIENYLTAHEGGRYGDDS